MIFYQIFLSELCKFLSKYYDELSKLTYLDEQSYDTLKIIIFYSIFIFI